MKNRGVVACGHPLTAEAAERTLLDGGNAFDAVVAAHFAACATEPVLASLGGGGYLLARTADQQEVVYDFFSQTPMNPQPGVDLDFYPIHADFGSVTQEFHIGAGSIATPGAVKGMFAIHRDLCSMPMRELAQPAIEAMKQGVVINSLQSYLIEIVQPILTSSPTTEAIYRSKTQTGKLLQVGEKLLQPELADALEAIVCEGERLFYEGEIASLIVKQCESGGHLGAEDLRHYEVIKRQPLKTQYRGVQFLSNPPPASGGILIAFALQLLTELKLHEQAYGSFQHLSLLAEVMELTNKARIDQASDQHHTPNTYSLLDGPFLDRYRREIQHRAACLRGTTHISVMDCDGNMAAMTVSNGEGCGQVLEQTGIMLNNMLGEEDINPQGFQHWPANQRMTSMMAPSILLYADGRSVVLGSGGSNRIRTAILQVLSNLLDFGLPLQEAVEKPRIHYESNYLNLEHGFASSVLEKLYDRYTEHKQWSELNLFFGGVHSVMNHGSYFSGVGDPRRDGEARII